MKFCTKRNVFLPIIYLAVATISGCGGGGSGSGSGDSSGGQNANRCLRVVEVEMEATIFTADDDWIDTFTTSNCSVEADTYREKTNLKGETDHPLQKKNGSINFSWGNRATGQVGKGKVHTVYQVRFLYGVDVSGYKTFWTIDDDISLVIGKNIITVTLSDGRHFKVVLYRVKDTRPPKIRYRSPQANERDVPVNRKLVLRFSESIKYGIEQLNSIKLLDADGRQVPGKALDNAPELEWSFKPDSPLEYGADYRIVIAGDVTDLYGNNGFGKKGEWSFTTALNPDDEAPLVTSVYPRSGSTCAPADSALSATFNEPLDSSSVNASTFSLLDSSGAPVTGTVSYDAGVARLNPDIGLLSSESYTARLSSEVKDLADNSLDSYEWRFTTPDGREANGGWSEVSYVGQPLNRWRHNLIWTGSEVIMWGGLGIGSYGSFNVRGKKYDPVTNSWQAMNETGSTGGEQSAVWTGTEMIVWKGAGSRYDPALDSWAPVSNLDAPSARRKHVAVWTGSHMIIWGGVLGNSVYGNWVPTNTGAIYDPIADSWSPISMDGAPSPRSHVSSIWTGTELLVWGGVETKSGATAKGGARYDPLTDTWRPISSHDAPTTNKNTAAIWTGSQMIVWSGGYLSKSDREIASEISSSATLQLYDPSTDRWTRSDSSCEPYFPPQIGQDWTSFAMHWTGDRVFAWSNNGTGGYFYDPVIDEWEAISTVGDPVPRQHFASTWAGDRFVIWGGHNLESFDSRGLVFKHW